MCIPVRVMRRTVLSTMERASCDMCHEVAPQLKTESTFVRRRSNLSLIGTALVSNLPKFARTWTSQRPRGRKNRCAAPQGGRLAPIGRRARSGPTPAKFLTNLMKKKRTGLATLPECMGPNAGRRSWTAGWGAASAAGAMRLNTLLRSGEAVRRRRHGTKSAECPARLAEIAATWTSAMMSWARAATSSSRLRRATAHGGGAKRRAVAAAVATATRLPSQSQAPRPGTTPKHTFVDHAFTNCN